MRYFFNWINCNINQNQDYYLSSSKNPDLRQSSLGISQFINSQLFTSSFSACTRMLLFDRKSNNSNMNCCLLVYWLNHDDLGYC